MKTLLLVCAIATQAAAPAPATGRDVVARMHAAYDGKWFSTLTFVQKTTVHRADGTTTEQTWYESVQAPKRLRIDIAPLADGNGSLNTPESVTVIRGGKVAAERPTGNPFLPFVVGIYTQPVDASMTELAHEKYDMSVVSPTTYRGRATWIVGARPGDVSVPQFWVDAERLIVTRALLPSGSSMLDVTLDDYQRAGGGWVAVRVAMSSNGAVRQLEEYSDVRADVPLDPALFAPATWSTARHWATSRRRVGNEFVAETVDGEDVARVLHVGLDLLAQPGDMDVYRAGGWHRVVTPHVVEQFVARQRRLRMLHEVLQQQKLAR
jgi:hypothetical protein